VKLTFTPDGWDDYLYWQGADRATLRKVNRLIQAILRDPFEGIGKPEPLKHNLAGAWSRRINEEHRLVYLPTETDMTILAARFHYTD